MGLPGGAFHRIEIRFLALTMLLLGGGYVYQRFEHATASGRVPAARWVAPAAPGAPAVATATAAAVSATTAPAGAIAGVGPDGKIDLNAASATVLEQLPGVGPRRAQAILDERVRRGGFACVEDLDAVPGIGPAALEKMRAVAEVRLGRGADAVGAPGIAGPGLEPVVPASPSGSASPPRPVAASTRPPLGVAATPAPVVNVNTATASQLEDLNGIGPALAARIIEERNVHGAFQSLADLAKRVKGIGPAILRRNADRLLCR